MTSTGLIPVASRVATASAAIDKIEALHAGVYAETRVEVGQLDDLAAAIMPQLKSRARENRAVRDAYSSLFAYHHARHPGHGPVPVPGPQDPADPTPAAGPSKR